MIKEIIMKTLIVIDVQNDFVTGSLGTLEAQAIIPNVRKKIAEYRERNDKIIFTQDTHDSNYLETNEGKHLPVPHCIAGTDGWKIVDELSNDEDIIVYKSTFGNLYWSKLVSQWDDTIEIIGLCTDICVISNALILKAMFPNIKITVDASCCAGVTSETHKSAIEVMKMCQIDIIGE
jgi:nicotinamidase-related amidase